MSYGLLKNTFTLQKLNDKFLRQPKIKSLEDKDINYFFLLELDPDLGPKKSF